MVEAITGKFNHFFSFAQWKSDVKKFLAFFESRARVFSDIDIFTSLFRLSHWGNEQSWGISMVEAITGKFNQFFSFAQWKSDVKKFLAFFESRARVFSDIDIFHKFISIEPLGKRAKLGNFDGWSDYR